MPVLNELLIYIKTKYVIKKQNIELLNLKKVIKVYLRSKSEK